MPFLHYFMRSLSKGLFIVTPELTLTSKNQPCQRQIVSFYFPNILPITFPFKFRNKITNFAAFYNFNICVLQWNAFIVECIIDISIEKHFQFVWRLDLNKTKEHTMHMMNFLPLLFVQVVFRSFLTTIMCVWLGHKYIFLLSFSLIHLNATITSPIKNHFVCSISIFDFILFFFVSFRFIWFCYFSSIISISRFQFLICFMLYW